MKTFTFACLVLLFTNPLCAQYGGYSPAGSTNYLGNNSAHGVFADLTYNDGSITSSPSATVYFIGSATNMQHQILANNGGATATQIGNAILQNGTGGLLINNPSTGLEIITNFNFNGQNAQVTTLRDASAVASNNLHIDANATITGSTGSNNVNGYLKKDGDAAAFSFPLADGVTHGPMSIGSFGAGNSLIAAYYNSSPSAAQAFEGGPFPITSLSNPLITVSSIEYWNINSIGTPSANLTLTFNGDYSSASLASFFIMGWRISTGEWEQIPTGSATGLAPGNSINSTGNVNFSDYAAFTLGFIPPPIVTAIADSATCGLQNGIITATGTKGVPPYQFSINGITYQSSNIFNGLDTGNYVVTIKDSYGLTDTVSIEVKGAPPGILFAGNDTSMTINQPLQLNAVDVNNEGYNQFTWSPAYGLNDPTIQNPIATLDKDITYTVTAVSPNGCQASAKIAIKVYRGPEIYVPTGFTPNGDGRNDILKVTAVGIKEFKYFMVYNRWGQRIFYTTNPSVGWDGKIGSQLQSADSFVWMAEGIDFKGNIIFRKGTVVLVR